MNTMLEWRECIADQWTDQMEPRYRELFECVKSYKDEINPYYQQKVIGQDGDEINRWEQIRRQWNKCEFIFQSNQNDKEQSICKLQPISRAFFKCWEILDHYGFANELYKLKTLHLAEAPGGFIESFVYYRQQSLDEYYGISLSNTNPSIPSWGKLLEKRRKNTYYQPIKRLEYADIMDEQAMHMWMETKMKWKTCDYITADGGFDFRCDFNGQEKMVFPLLYFESVWALCFLKEGGTFICKCFDFYTSFTQEWLLWTRQYFESWDIYKPHFSRDANSEKYVIFRGKKEIKEEDLEKMSTFFFQDALPKWKGSTDMCYWLVKGEHTEEDKKDLDRLYEYLVQYSDHQRDTIAFLIQKLNEENSQELVHAQQLHKTYMYEAIGEALKWCDQHRLPINHQSRHLKYYHFEKEYRESLLKKETTSSLEHE
jgi:23S rRNA U2552 (ribose-2'-O)-methylase RlmE/FtsJ